MRTFKEAINGYLETHQVTALYRANIVENRYNEISVTLFGVTFEDLPKQRTLMYGVTLTSDESEAISYVESLATSYIDGEGCEPLRATTQALDVIMANPT